MSVSVISARFAQKGRVIATIRAMLGVAPIAPPVVTQPPMPPAAVTVTPSHLVNVVVWSITNDADTYTVLRSDVSGGPYSQVASGVTASFWADYNVTAGVEYFYVVRSVSTQSGPGENSIQASGVPLNMLPGSFTFSLENGVGQVRLILDTLSVGSTYYDVKVGDVESTAVLVATLAETEFPFTDDELTVDVPRKYWFYAKNTYGSIASTSNPKIGTPQDIPYPTAPAFTVTALNSAAQINLTGSSLGATTYTIKQGATEGAASEVATIMEGTFPYTHSGQANGVPVKYWVYANNARGATAATDNGKEVTPLAPVVIITPPGAFSFTLTPGDGKVTVNLTTESTGSDFYRIFTGTWGTPDWTQRGGDINSSAFPYEITGIYVVNDSALRVFVSAFNNNGTQVTQATGNPQVATPDDGKPDAFTFTATAGEEIVTIALTTPSNGATTYTIQRDGVDFETGVLVSAFPRSDTTMTNNVQHLYTLFAVNANGSRAASNNPQAAMPWALGLSYPSGTISWDAADASKFDKFSGVQNINKWRSKNSDAIYLEGTVSTTSCVHTAATTSVDASATTPTNLKSVGLDVPKPYTVGAYMFFPSDSTPAEGNVLGLSATCRVQFRPEASYDTVVFAQGTIGLYCAYGTSVGVLRGNWVRVVVIVPADGMSAKIRVNGVERSDSVTGAIASVNHLDINSVNNGAGGSPTNVRVRRLAVVGQELSGQELADFESILLEGEGSSTPPVTPPISTITSSHPDKHAWADPREPWSSLTSGWQSNTLAPTTQNPALWTEPGAKAPQDGVELTTRVSSPNNANGKAYLHRIRQQNPAWDGVTWRSGFNTGGSAERIIQGNKYIEAFGFRFTAECLATNQRELDIYEHHCAIDPAPYGIQSGFVIYLKTFDGNPRLEIRYRYSLDGTQASSVGGLIATVQLQPDKWYLFAHRFSEHTDLTLVPYNRIWMAVDDGAITQIADVSVRNRNASPPAPSNYTYAKMENYQYYAWNPGVTQRHFYSTGIHIFKDRGGSPALNEFSLIGLLREIVQPTNAIPAELDPVTDNRCTMYYDANKTFAQLAASGSRKRLEVISGFANGFNTDFVDQIPATGLQVDSTARRILKHTTGVPGMASAQQWFLMQLDETLPKYNNTTIRCTVGRADYSSEITNDGVAHYVIWDYAVTRSMYADMNHKSDGNPIDFSIHGLHHVAGWGANASVSLLTPFTGFILNRSDRTGMHFFYRVRSNTNVTGTAANDQQHTLTWSTPAENHNVLETSTDLYLKDDQGTNILIQEGQHHKFAVRWRLNWQKGTGPDGNGPVFEYWHQLNSGPIRKIARYTGPVGHRLTDMTHQLRTAALYNWYVEFNEAMAWNRSQTGIILQGNRGFAAYTRTGNHFFDIPATGKPDITIDRLFSILNRP